MDWSAFPSDHAVMYSALAVGLCFVSLRLGLFATVYVVCAICFPRAYLGYHYPTDLLVGAVIGALCAYGFNLPAARRWLAGATAALRALLAASVLHGPVLPDFPVRDDVRQPA